MNNRTQLAPDQIEAEYVTPAVAAKVLGICRKTLYKWLRDGQIPARRIGGIWLVPKKSLNIEGS